MKRKRTDLARETTQKITRITNKNIKHDRKERKTIEKYEAALFVSSCLTILKRRKKGHVNKNERVRQT